MSKPAKKILIVEDEEPLSNILCDQLTGEGFDVVIARNGSKGVNMAISEKPDLILLDILLPKKSGLTVIKELHEHKETSSIPVIMLTNLSDTDSVNESLNFEAYDFMVKSDTKLSTIVDAIHTKLSV